MAADVSLRANSIKREHPAEEAVSWERLERQDWHLWILAILLMFVLGTSLLSFMFPTAFWFEEQLPLRGPQRAFLGFCVLLALAMVYMLQRQAAVRRLKRQLFEARMTALETERKATRQAFAILPDTDQFRDALSMEYRRASTSLSNLAVVIFELADASREQLGQATNLLRPILRRGESLFRVSDHSLGIILPGSQLSNAASFAAQVEEHFGIHLPEVKPSVTVTAYPEAAASLSEMEARLRGRATVA